MPQDFDGIPILDNLRSWFFSFSTERKPEDIPALWRVFRLAQGEAPLDNELFAEAFDAALKVRMVNVNLTMGLFWIRPQRFLSLDSTNRAYLNIALPAGGLSFAFYRDTVHKVASRGVSVPQVSHQAWLAGTSIPGSSVGTSQPTAKSLAQPGFWLVGAYWSGNDPPDQTQRFCAEGIWENGYEDRYLDEVRSIRGWRQDCYQVSSYAEGWPAFRFCRQNGFLYDD